MYSGGKGSFIAATKAAERFGKSETVLLFADTLVEDPDVYKFITTSADYIGCKLIRVADGRTPFEVFTERKWLGNSRLAHCSQDLKIAPCRKWVAENATNETVIVVGIDWSEMHRVNAITAGYAPLEVYAPLCEKPLLSVKDMLKLIAATGLELPLSYAQGFPHANCMQQGCVKGGRAYWQHFLRVRPDKYKETEQAEQNLRKAIGKDVTMLKYNIANITKYQTLRDFRKQLEKAPDMFNNNGDWGGCGCFVDNELEIQQS